MATMILPQMNRQDTYTEVEVKARIISADAACRKASFFLVMNIGHLLRAENPKLLLDDEVKSHARRRKQYIPVTLSLPAEPLTQAEIDAVLMATDAIISQAGRNGVALILNGSRSQKVKCLEWDKLPEYGLLSHLTAKEIGTKVDWCIHYGWLRIEYSYDGIPLLLHTAKSWPHVKQLWIERILDWFTTWQAAVTPEQMWTRLETINPDIKYLLLEMLREWPQKDFASILCAWFLHEVRKIRKAINHTLQTWGQRPFPILHTPQLHTHNSETII